MSHVDQPHGRASVWGGLAACAAGLAAAMDVLASPLPATSGGAVGVGLVAGTAALLGAASAWILRNGWTAGVWLGARSRLGSTRGPFALLGFVAALAGLVAAMSVLGGRGIRDTWIGRWGPAMAPLAAAIGAVAGAIILRALAPRVVAARAAYRLPLGGALLVFGLFATSQHDRQLFVLLPAARVVVVLGGLLLATTGAVIGLPARWLRTRAPLLAASATMATLGILLLVPLPPPIVGGMAARGTLTEATLLAWWSALDVDGDGFSSLLSGGDCDEGDGRRNPLAAERPGDGVDTDCDGEDGDDTAPVAVPASYAGPDDDRLERLRARTRGRSTLVILVDALRADRVHGPRAARFGALAELGRRGASFHEAYTPKPSTAGAMAALWTGATHGGAATGAHVAKTLGGAGYATALIALDPVLEVLAEARPLVGGFEAVERVPVEGADVSAWGGGVTARYGEALARRTLEWLDGRDTKRPFFVWLHLFSAHQWLVLSDASKIPDDRDRYDEALVDDDDAVAAVLRGLKARGLSDEVMVVLLGDHGEAVGDRGWRTHTVWVYPEITRVPWVWAIPGWSPAPIPTPVSIASLHATLADLLAGQPGPGGVEPSVAPLIALGSEAPAAAPRPVVLDGLAQDGLIFGERVLRSTHGGRVLELLDLTDHHAAVGVNRSRTEIATLRQMWSLLRERTSQGR